MSQTIDTPGSTKKQNPTTIGLIFALAGFAVFALHDAVIKTLPEYSVFQIMFFSVLFSHVPFTFFLAADEQARNLRPVHPVWMLFRSLCMVASGCFAFYAFSSLALAQAYSLLFAMPLLITLLAIPILGEKVRLRRWLAIIFGLAGVLVTLRPGGQELQLGHLSALAAALCSALSGVITRKVGGQERSATLILYPLIINVVFTGIALTFVYQPMPLGDLARMAVLGLLGMTGQFAMIRAYKSAPAALVASFQYSQIVWAIFYGYFWFGDVPDQFVFIGSGMIIMAGLMIVWRESSPGVSSQQPYLNTRNSRYISAPPVPSCKTAENQIPKVSPRFNY